jgi:hypothetical protein
MLGVFHEKGQGSHSPLPSMTPTSTVINRCDRWDTFVSTAVTSCHSVLPSSLLLNTSTWNGLSSERKLRIARTTPNPANQGPSYVATARHLLNHGINRKSSFVNALEIASRSTRSEISNPSALHLAPIVKACRAGILIAASTNPEMVEHPVRTVHTVHPNPVFQIRPIRPTGLQGPPAS